MDNPNKHVIIVGGGFGGISTAQELASADVDVTIIDRTNHHLFQPLLYQVATAALSPGDIASPIRAIFGKYPRIKVCMGEVKRIDKENKKIFMSDNRAIAFDYLVLAPGASDTYFGHDEWRQYAQSLKTLSDALSIREQILLSLERAEQLGDNELQKPYLTFVIIGGGPTGVEMAGAIAEIAKRSMMRDYHTFSKEQTDIFLIEAGPRLLGSFSEALSSWATRALEKMGVRVLLNTPVTDIIPGQVVFENGSIESSNIIWAAGVSASPLLDSLDADRGQGGRVKVECDLTLQGYRSIFVIGDAAYFEDDAGKAAPALAPVATQQGQYVGRLIRLGAHDAPRKPFRYVDKGTMATIGRAKAVAHIKGLSFTGLTAWLLWSLVHIFYLIGFRNRLRVFVEWVWYYFTFRRGVRLVTDRSWRENQWD